MLVRTSLISLFLLALLASLNARAQNYQREEEEAILDQERQRRVEEIIQQREREAEELLEKPLTEEEIKNRKLVEVEPNNILPSDLTNIYSLVPYAVRRNRWGWYYGVTYSMYHPDQFASDYFDPNLATFDELYSSAQLPLVEFFITYKWNFKLGSLGLDTAIGLYENDNADEDLMGDARLSLQMVRVGLRYTMDNITYEPYVAPYAIGGAYMVRFEEMQGGAKYSGTTMVAPYWGLGLLFQLNWLDQTAAVEAYSSAQIENTFLFLEGRQYLASSEAKDPDFSTAMDLAGGISLEF